LAKHLLTVTIERSKYKIAILIAIGRFAYNLTETFLRMMV